MDFLALWAILESVTYLFSTNPIVGAQGLDSETWERSIRSKQTA